jgi:hypothetical protein
MLIVQNVKVLKEIKVNNEIAVKQQNSPSMLIEMAIKNNSSIENLEKLMDMQIKWDASLAQKQYFISLSKFQELCPVITKNKQAHNYMYAPMSDIIQQIKKPLNQVGISYRFEQTESDTGSIKITCVTTHIDGHNEKTSMVANADTSGSKNAVQAIGSTVTYLQRYTLLGSLGISTADSDMDGRLPTDVNWEEQYNNLITHIAAVRTLFDEIVQIKTFLANDDPVSGKQSFIDLTQDEQKSLWRAPSKGGIFETAELKLLKETSANLNTE